MLEDNPEFVRKLMDLGIEQQEAIDCLKVVYTSETILPAASANHVSYSLGLQ